MSQDGTPESGTLRPGEMERFAIDEALRAARFSVFWNTHMGRFEYGFVDYFEATVARNLAGLADLEELGEAMERRGIVPQSDDDQAKLVTDGGEDVVEDQHGDQAEYCEMAEEYILGRTEDGKCPLCREDISEQMEDLEDRLEERGVSIDV